jgi:ribonuclease J
MRLSEVAAADFVTEDDIDDVPDDNLLILITGSQGEPRSALARSPPTPSARVVAGRGRYGDLLVSRMIPGNERAIGTVQDNLVRRGVRRDDR